MKQYVEPNMEIVYITFSDIVCTSDPEIKNKDIIEDDSDGQTINIP